MNYTDVNDFNLIKGQFVNVLKKKYDVNNNIVFKHINKNMVDVYLEDDLILGIHYIVMENTITQKMVDIRITNYKDFSVSERALILLAKYSAHDLKFQSSIVRILEEVGLVIEKEINVVNNAQEIIEITKKAKEENIKKDIDELESLILEKARDGREGLMFKLSKLKSDILKEESDNDIFKHFRNKGFKCSISNGYSDRYLNITWGD